MKIDLCKIFGVEEGEEFKIKSSGVTENCIYIIQYNSLRVRDKARKDFRDSILELNEIKDAEIIKLPKKKEFTDDELAIMRSLPKKYKWIARDGINNVLCIYQLKPEKHSECWLSAMACVHLHMFSHLFNSILWEDEEPVFIDDYVERGGIDDNNK